MALSVEENIQTHIAACTTAIEIWNVLKNLYENTGLSRKIGILRQMISSRLDESTGMQEYIDTIINYSNKLAGIGFGISDEWIAAILLAGLTENFQPFIMALEASDDGLKKDVIISKLLDAYQPGNSSHDAFFAKIGPWNKGKKHWEPRKCFKCGSTDHLKRNCEKKTQNGKTEERAAFLALMCQSEQEDDWYLDSGSSNHATPREDLFTSIDSVVSHEIRAANNATMKAESAGTIQLTIDETELVMKDVLHVPGCAANLLSVSKICEKGNKIIFDVNGCRIYSGSGNLVMECKPKNGVYKFRGSPTKPQAFLVKDNDSLELWHKRLGHMNYNYMQKMKKGAVTGINFKDGTIGLSNCEICAEGKQSRLPFKSSNSQSKEFLELVHSDVAGPMENLSLGGARYMLTFIDDFTKKAFVYFLKAKSEVFETFISFKAFVENQTGKTLKTLRTDNGTEYFNNQLINYCRSKGIQHQSTQTYTPQQNGVAERFNRTIEEKGRCLIFEANLDKAYWAEACSMAVYLANRSVNASLTTKTPEELWSGRKLICLI